MSCPRCESKRTKWRSGVYFDNEMICFNCWATWEPGTQQERDLYAEGAEARAKEKAFKAALEQRVISLGDARMSGMGMDAPE